MELRMKEYAVGFSIAIILAVAIYFFYIVPEQKRVEERINEAYQAGLTECIDNVDTLYLPGKEIIVYRDTTINVIKPVEVTQNDNEYMLVSSVDTSFVGEKDSIGVQMTVKMDFVLNENYEIKQDSVSSEWFGAITHKHYDQQPDTLKIYVPKFIEQVVVENNWLYNLLSYIGGIASAVIVFLLAN
jgi:hypothetical protein